MDIVRKTFRSSKNDTGSLTFLEAERDIPFQIRRVYYIYGVREGSRRGFHAHKELQQYLVCLCGSCKILLDDGKEKATIELASPSEGLYVAPGVWHEMYDFSEGTVLMALASDYYDEKDYIRDYDIFLDYMRRGRP